MARQTKEQKIAALTQQVELETAVKVARVNLDAALKQVATAAKDGTFDEGFENVVEALSVARVEYIGAKMALAEAKA